MRRGNKLTWLEHEGEVIGVNLGADYCAEHEWGTNKLKKMLGIPTAEEADEKRIFGLGRRLVGKDIALNMLLWRESGDEAYLACSRDIMSPYFGKEYVGATVETLNEFPSYRSELRLPSFDYEKLLAKREKKKFVPPTDLLAGAWSDDDFGIHVKGPTAIKNLRGIFEAFSRHDICMFLGGARIPVFENAGLNIVIASRLPASVQNEMREVDLDAFNLKEAAEKTGIKNRLKAAGLGFYALSPHWREGFLKDRETKHNVVFFLNPFDQHKYESGWVTVEELDEWIAGKGRIIKSKEKVSK